MLAGRLLVRLHGHQATQPLDVFLGMKELKQGMSYPVEIYSQTIIK